MCCVPMDASCSFQSVKYKFCLLFRTAAKYILLRRNTRNHRSLKTYCSHKYKLVQRRNTSLKHLRCHMTIFVNIRKYIYYTFCITWTRNQPTLTMFQLYRLQHKQHYLCSQLEQKTKETSQQTIKMRDGCFVFHSGSSCFESLPG